MKENTKAISTLNNGVDKDELEKALKSFVASNDLFQKVGPAKVEAFFQVARAFGLNPFKREIHAVPHYDKQTGTYNLTIITGYEVYLKRAEESGKWGGFTIKSEVIPNEWVYCDEPRYTWVFVHKQPAAGIYYSNSKITVTVHRKDWKQPYEHEVFLNEIIQYSQPWKKQPQYMGKKVGLEQALRWVFPDQVGGLPYTDDELPVETKDRVSEAKTVQIKEEKPQEPIKAFAAGLPTEKDKQEETTAPAITKQESVDVKLKYARSVANLQERFKRATTDEEIKTVTGKAKAALKMLSEYPDLLEQVQEIVDSEADIEPVEVVDGKLTDNDDVFATMKDI